VKHKPVDTGKGSAMAANTIGFIGLGKMGQPMARRLMAAGYTLALYDANQDAVAVLSGQPGGQHAILCATPAEVATQAGIIITMLPTSGVLEAVLTGVDGVFAALRAGAIIIDMGSGTPAITQTLARTAHAHGGHLVDAPVSGGVPRAVTGELAIMFGGSQTLLARVEPVLRTMGASVTRTGKVGTAHAMKALNNLVSAGGFLIGVEAILMGKRFGLDAGVMVDILNASTGMNNSTQKKFKQFVLSGGYDSGFGLALMVKDLGIALGLDTTHSALFSQHCLAIWHAGAQALEPEADHTALARHVSDYCGVPWS